jgi:carbonic anhydrase/acetyltransferase-like protein (isoleucine patch superfamily)
MALPFNLDRALDEVDSTVFIANTATLVGDVTGSMWS